MISGSTPVGDLKMVGPLYEARLKKMDINTVEDLLNHIPFRYENYSLISQIGNLQEEETVTVFGRIIKFENFYSKSGKKIQKTIIVDDTGNIQLIFFNQPYLINILKPGLSITVAGTVKRYIKDLA